MAQSRAGAGWASGSCCQPPAWTDGAQLFLGAASSVQLQLSFLVVFVFYLKDKPGTTELSCHNLWHTGSGLY